MARSLGAPWQPFLDVSISTMVWCNQCGEVEAEEEQGLSLCPGCGRVLAETVFANDVQFQKGADGDVGVAGQYVGENGRARGQGRYGGGRSFGGVSQRGLLRQASRTLERLLQVAASISQCANKGATLLCAAG